MVYVLAQSRERFSTFVFDLCLLHVKPWEDLCTMRIEPRQLARLRERVSDKVTQLEPSYKLRASGHKGSGKVLDT